MRLALLIAATLLHGAAAQSQDTAEPAIATTPIDLVNASPTPLTVREKAAVHAARFIDPINIGRSLASAAIDQGFDDPTEWGQGAAGYGRRFASKVGQRAVRSTLSFGVEAAFDLDSRYYRAPEKRFWGRMGNAVKQTFLVRTDAGRWTVDAPNFAAAYGGSAISNLWRPDSETGWSDTLGRATMSLGIDAGMNVFKEFWPDIKRRVFRR